MSQSANSLLDGLSDYVSARRARELRAAAAVHRATRFFVQAKFDVQGSKFEAPVNGHHRPICEICGDALKKGIRCSVHRKALVSVKHATRN